MQNRANRFFLRNSAMKPGISFFTTPIEKSPARRCMAALLLVLCLACAPAAWPQQQPASQRVANSAIKQWPAGPATPGTKETSNEELGLLLNGMQAVWLNTANHAYFEYLKQSVDSRLQPDGSIAGPAANASENDALGRQLLFLYRTTLDARYYKSATLLRKQLSTQPNDPDPMQLDATEPFLAEYASVFQEPDEFAEITKQLSSKTGQPHQARATAQYVMALVDTLPYYPKDNPGRTTLLDILNHTAAAITRHQDKTGLWPQDLDKPASHPIDQSTACIFTYALQKAVRLGYLPQAYSQNAVRAWQRIETNFVRPDRDGLSLLADHDPKAVGAFLLASSEMELAAESNLAHHKTVMVDAWFNSQQRMNAAGQKEYFHYKWNDESDSGFSFFGHIFESHGAILDTLYTAPTLDRLKAAQYYIIVSPDIPIKNPRPNYVQPDDARPVAEWVRQGGVLILMENDPPNADIEHLNLIADTFGIHFNNVLSHHVIGDQFENGWIAASGGGPLFYNPHKLYMKDTCTISLKGSALPLLQDKGDILIATVKYGKGTVLAIADPWLYNEYTDRRKLSPEQDNFEAGKELVRWLLQQAPRNAHSSPEP